MDVRRLVSYNHAQRRRFAEFFAKEVPWDVLVENHETSHQNIVNVFMHGCNMEDWWINYVRAGKAWDGPAFDGFTDAASVVARVAEVEARTNAWMSKQSADDLASKVTLQPAPDHTVHRTLSDLLAEVVLEDIHHRGEILAMLWRKDIEPPYESFLDWAGDH